MKRFRHGISVKTSGDALLRNGIIKVSEIYLTSDIFEDSNVVIKVITGKGNIATGYISVKQDDFTELCRKYLEVVGG